LVTTAPKRVPAFPQIPTMAEKGFPEASLNIWLGLYVPAKTPQPITEVLSKALAQAARDPAVVSAIEKAGMQMDYRDAEGTRRLLEDEHKAVRAAAEKLGMTK
jgi:tripartite-type tricarboxylate transporter receptor subunit TctC